jgi:hypothetical protein
MDRPMINYVVDVLLGMTFLIAFITGVLKYPGVPGYLGGMNMVLPYVTLTTLHDWSGILMGALVAIHLALHWRWIVAMTRRMLGRSRPEIPG